MSGDPNELPVEVIRHLLDRYGELMLVGAFARDRIVRVKAGLALGRTTHDLDLAMAVPSVQEFGHVTSTLGNGGATGMRFTVGGVPVDLIPFSPEGALEQPIALADGILMDTTGMDEAFASAERDSDDLVGLRYPSLHGLVVLKTIAWNMRGADKSSDADDLALLLRCADAGEYEERCYGDLLGAAWADGDPARVGAYLIGRDAARDLPKATEVIVKSWGSPGLRSACARAPLGGPAGGRIDGLLDALRLGAETGHSGPGS